MSEWLSIGPINGLVLILCLLGGGLTVGHATLRMRRSAHVPLIPMIAAIAAPLLFTLYAVTMQYTAGMDAAANHPVPIARQTLMAATLSKAVMTQILGGGISAAIALGMIGLCLGHASLGERPRTGIALGAAGLTFCLTATALGKWRGLGCMGIGGHPSTSGVVGRRCRHSGLIVYPSTGSGGANRAYRSHHVAFVCCGHRCGRMWLAL